MSDTIKPDQTIAEYIESIRDKDINTLKGYALRAHSNGKHKVNRAIHTLIREKEALGSDELYNAFVIRLAAETEQRHKAAPCRKLKPKYEFDRTISDYEKKRLIYLKGQLSLEDPQLRQIIQSWEEFQKYKKYMIDNRTTHEMVIEEVKHMIVDNEHIRGREQKAKNVKVIFDYIIEYGEHMIAYHHKFRDTLLQKVLELSKDLHDYLPTEDNPSAKLVDQEVKTFIKEKVITSPYYIPSIWEISIKGVPDIETSAEQVKGVNIVPYFGEDRFQGDASLAAAQEWYKEHPV
jgi:hypothetical protein